MGSACPRERRYPGLHKSNKRYRQQLQQRLQHRLAHHLQRLLAHAHSDSRISWAILGKNLTLSCFLALLNNNEQLSHFLQLMTHLSEVETPLPGGVDSQDSGSEKYGLLEQDDYKDKKRVSAAAPKSAYLTSSIRATVRHLNAEAGDLSMFRGMGSASAIYLLCMPLSLCL